MLQFGDHHEPEIDTEVGNTVNTHHARKPKLVAK
jgi:hypothetical protein